MEVKGMKFESFSRVGNVFRFMKHYNQGNTKVLMQLARNKYGFYVSLNIFDSSRKQTGLQYAQFSLGGEYKKEYSQLSENIPDDFKEEKNSIDSKYMPLVLLAISRN